MYHVEFHREYIV